jgi:hypothetical protein
MHSVSNHTQKKILYLEALTPNDILTLAETFEGIQKFQKNASPNRLKKAIIVSKM